MQVDALDQLVDLVTQVDWSYGVAVWQKFFSFAHPISCQPQARWYPGISCERQKREAAARLEAQKLAAERGEDVVVEEPEDVQTSGIAGMPNFR